MNAANHVHIPARRSLWDGTVITVCGLRLKSGQYYTAGWFSCLPPCPVCKAGKR